MSAPNDGGSAFPVHEEFDERTGTYTRHASDGLSVRDYFAAAALQGWLAGVPDSQPIHEDAIAKRVYLLADAMLAERAK